MVCNLSPSLRASDGNAKNSLSTVHKMSLAQPPVAMQSEIQMESLLQLFIVLVTFAQCMPFKKNVLFLAIIQERFPDVPHEKLLCQRLSRYAK